MARASLSLYTLSLKKEARLAARAVAGVEVGKGKADLRLLLRVSILTRDIDIANLSVCLPVTFRYHMKTAHHIVTVFFTVR